MVKADVIRRRLLKIEEYQGILRGLAQVSSDEFCANPERYGAAERFLQLVIEATLDIGSHIVADEHLGVAEQSRDVAEVLHATGLIDKSLRDRWLKMIGFRNILVHDYLEVERKIVHRVLQENLDDLTSLSRILATFLK